MAKLYDLYAPTLTQSTPQMWHDRIGNNFFDKSKVPVELLPIAALCYAQPWAASRWSETMATMGSAERFRPFRILERLEQITVPTLVVWGRDDKGGSLERGGGRYRRDRAHAERQARDLRRVRPLSDDRAPGEVQQAGRRVPGRLEAARTTPAARSLGNARRRHAEPVAQDFVGVLAKRRPCPGNAARRLRQLREDALHRDRPDLGIGNFDDGTAGSEVRIGGNGRRIVHRPGRHAYFLHLGQERFRRERRGPAADQLVQLRLSFAARGMVSVAWVVGQLGRAHGGRQPAEQSVGIGRDQHEAAIARRIEILTARCAAGWDLCAAAPRPWRHIRR